MNHNSGTEAIFEHAQRMRVDCRSMALSGVVPGVCVYYFQRADLSYGTFVLFYTVEMFLSVFGPNFFPFVVPNLLCSLASYALISWISRSQLAVFRPCRMFCCPRPSTFSSWDKKTDDHEEGEDRPEDTPRGHRKRPRPSPTHHAPSTVLVVGQDHPYYGHQESPLPYGGMEPDGPYEIPPYRPYRAT